ncbi:MAG: AMP-binding protein [Antricoccus sp.]
MPKRETGPLDDPDLYCILRDKAAEDPDAISVIDPDPAGDKLLTRRDLVRLSGNVAHQLLSNGIEAGDCIAIWLPNWSHGLTFQIGATMLGAHIIGVNTRYNVDDVAHLLSHSRPKIIVVAHEFVGLDLLERLHKAVAASDVAPPKVAVVAGPHAPPVEAPEKYDCGAGAWSFSYGTEVLDESTGDHRDQLMAAFTTSGSTGLPKLAAHKQSGVIHHALAVRDTYEMHDGDCATGMLPLTGVFGFTCVYGALASGAKVLLEPVFNESQILANMAKYAVTHMFAGDDMMVRLRTAWESSQEDLSTWRIGGIANFMGKVPQIAAWAAQTYNAACLGVYGMSELFALMTRRNVDDPISLRYTPGGRLVSADYGVRIADPATDEVLPLDTDGELQFAGPPVVDAYLGNPDAMISNFTADGWLKSGDLGRMTDDRSFTFINRMGDVLRLRGYLVDPYEIEVRLLAHPAVEHARVVGVKGDDGADRAVGFVVLSSEVSAAELRTWCADTLATFKVPEQIRIIDSMPVTTGTNGTKIKVAELRKMAQAEI